MAKPEIIIPEEYQLEGIRPVLRALAALEAEIDMKQVKATGASGIAAVYVQAEASLRQLEVLYSRLTALGRKLQQEVVPELFRTDNATTSVTALGYRATISNVVRASIRKDMKEPAFAWLRKEGHGDIIKVEPSVHPETLAAWGRQELEQGNELPEDLFSVYTYENNIADEGQQEMNKQDVKTLDDSVPEYLQQYQGRTGLEDIGQDDIATPRLQLLQALSPQLEEDDSLKPGMFYHSGAEAGLPPDIMVVPLAIAKSYTLWRPRPASGILARSRDGINWDRTGSWPDIILKGGKRVTWSIKTLNVRQSKMAEWGSSDPDNADSNPAAVLAVNIPVLIPSHLHLGPAVLSMQRSQIKVARKLLGRLKLIKFPLWALEVPMCSIKDQGPEGPFFNISFGRKFGLIQDEVLAETCRNLFDMFQQKGVVVAEDEHEPDSAGPAAKDDLSDEIPY